VGDSAERAFADHSVWKLIEAFGKILEKSGGKAGVHNVLVDRVSIGDTMNTLLDRLETGGGSFRFDSCFNLSLPEAELRHQVVVTLLAMLELARLKVVRVLQSDTEETLFITKVTGASMEDARRAAAAQAAQAEQMEEAEQTGEAEQAGEAEQVEVAQQADEGEQVEVAQAAGEGEQAAEDRQTEGLEADASAEPDPAADAADQPMRTPEKIDEEA
jgi:segregation and condensation protein A